MSQITRIHGYQGYQENKGYHGYPGVQGHHGYLGDLKFKVPGKPIISKDIRDT